MPQPFPEGAPSPDGPATRDASPAGGARPAVPGADEPRGIFRPGGTAGLLTPRAAGILRLLVTILTVAMVAWYLHSRPAMDFSGFRLRWDRLALALALVVPLMALRIAKWRLLLRGLAPRITFAEAMRSYLGPMALALVTPGRVGELSRGLYQPHMAVRGWKGAGLVLVDSWTDFQGVLAWACVGFALAFGPWGLAAGLALLALFAPIPLWLRLGPPVLSRLPSRWGFRAWACRALPAPGDAADGDIALAGLLAAAASALEWLQVLLLLEGVTDIDLSLWRLGGVMALVALANTVQVTLGGLGVREGMAILLLGREGIGPEAAASAAFLQSALILLLPALLGLAVKPAAAASPKAPAAAGPAPSGPAAAGPDSPAKV